MILICFESQEISQPKQKKNKVLLNGFSNCIFTLQEFFSLSRKVKYIANLSLESLTVICKYVFNPEKNAIPFDPLCVTFIFRISQTCQHSTRSDIPTYV